jgi:hypothetical protein
MFGATQVKYYVEFKVLKYKKNPAIAGLLKFFE